MFVCQAIIAILHLKHLMVKDLVLLDFTVRRFESFFVSAVCDQC